MAATLVFPSHRLPLPKRDGYSLEPMDPIERTDMESGPARQEQLFTDVPTRFGLRWTFSAWEFAIFEAWIAHKAKLGAVWFQMPLLSGLGIDAHEVRFLGDGKKPYNAKPISGGRWDVTSGLEARQRPILDEGTLDLVLSEDVEALIAAAASFDLLVNNTFSSLSW
jgi:hypothetical protein